MNRDEQNMLIARAVAQGSKCVSGSGKKGAIIVRNKKIIATGYSGPPAGIEPCWIRLKEFRVFDHIEEDFGICRTISCGHEQCPRVAAGFQGAEGLEWCVSCHAEVNAIVTAAFTGVSVEGAIMYLYAPVMPCKTCAGYIINSGIEEVVGLTLKEYELEISVKNLFHCAGVCYRTISFVEV